MKILDNINTKASSKRVLIHFLTSILLGTCIVTMLFGIIKLNPNATMDSLTFYKSNTFFNYLDIQGENGRNSYLLLHLIDYLFITQFYLFLAFSISKLLQKISNNYKLTFLALLPLISGSMDLLENIIIDISILFYPIKIIILGDISGFATAVKMYSLYIVFIVLFVSLIILGCKIIKDKIWNQS